jgi:hypothetical protein
VQQSVAIEGIADIKPGCLAAGPATADLIHAFHDDLRS